MSNDGVIVISSILAISINIYATWTMRDLKWKRKDQMNINWNQNKQKKQLTSMEEEKTPNEPRLSKLIIKHHDKHRQGYYRSQNTFFAYIASHSSI